MLEGLGVPHIECLHMVRNAFLFPRKKRVGHERPDKIDNKLEGSNPRRDLKQYRSNLECRSNVKVCTRPYHKPVKCEGNMLAPEGNTTLKPLSIFL